MKFSYDWLRRSIAIGLAMLLIAPFGNAATTPQDQSAAPQQTQGAAPSQSQQQNPAPGAANPSSAQLPAAPQASSAQPRQQQQEDQNHQPVGTAAAPYETPVGVAVSRPAGAAIAPAKQRRTRSFIIKMSLVVGAAVAIGTVAALSKGSPSRPH